MNYMRGQIPNLRNIKIKFLLQLQFLFNLLSIYKRDYFTIAYFKSNHLLNVCYVLGTN